MKLCLCDYRRLFLIPIFLANLIYQSDGGSLTKEAEGNTGPEGKSSARRSSKVEISPGMYSSPFKKTYEDKTRSKVKLTSKAEVHVLNQHPDLVSVYEIPFPLGHADVKKPDRVKKKIPSGKPEDKNSSNLSKLSDSSILSKMAEYSKYSVLDPRTLMMAPLLAAPVVLAEAMTLGGVGIAVPALIILPFLIFPLVVIAFIMYI